MAYQIENQTRGLEPRQGFFVQFKNQKSKGILHEYSDSLKMALVSFRVFNDEWGDPEACDIEDLILWSEGISPVPVIRPCITMFQSWKGYKCNTCPYQDII